MALEVYLKYIAWVFVGGLLISKLSTRRHIMVLGNKRERWSVIATILFLAPLAYWCANRPLNYGDTSSYLSMFNRAPETLSGLQAYSETLTKDKPFYIASALAKIFITKDIVTYFLIIATIQLLCIGLVYRKYSRSLWISIFLFVASTDYNAWMFNGMRQFLAAAISFTALPFIVRKKYIPAVLLIILASGCHKTALLLLPVMLIVQGDAWNRKTLLAIVGAMVAVVFVNEFTGILDGLLQDTQYENVVSDWTSSNDDGTNVIRVLVYAVPTILSLVFRSKVREADNALVNICVNMSIMSTAVYIISIFTSGIFIGRLPIYMSLYNYILLPWEIRHCFDRRTRPAITALMCIGYLGFFVYSYM